MIRKDNSNERLILNVGLLLISAAKLMKRIETAKPLAIVYVDFPRSLFGSRQEK
jgi:hypothetical protein